MVIIFSFVIPSFAQNAERFDELNRRIEEISRQVEKCGADYFFDKSEEYLKVIEVLQTREEKLKQFKAWLLLADEILREKGELSPHRFTGIDVSFPEAITAQQYPNLIFRITPTAKHALALNKLLLFLCLTQVII